MAAKIVELEVTIEGQLAVDERCRVNVDDRLNLSIRVPCQRYHAKLIPEKSACGLQQRNHTRARRAFRRDVHVNEVGRGGARVVPFHVVKYRNGFEIHFTSNVMKTPCRSCLRGDS